jgi:hypothetical protein
MKLSAPIAALVLAAAPAAFAAEPMVISSPMVYTQPVIYAAGVTYHSQVQYQAALTAAEPVVLEGIVVTPKRTYSASEYASLMASRKLGGNRRLASKHRSADSFRGSAVKAWLPVFN